MATLRRRPDGGYYTVVKNYGQIATLQIHPEGGNYLLEHDVRPGMEIPDAYRRHLWDQGWFYTKGEQGPGELEEEYETVKDLDEAEELFESSLDDLPNDYGNDQAPDTEIIDVVSNDPIQAHASRPVFLFDGPTRTYYTVLHLNGENGYTEPIVMCIKYRAAQWLKERGASLGKELPEGTFETVFLNRWFYPSPGWKPYASQRLPLNWESSPLQQSSESIAGMVGCLTIVLALLIYSTCTSISPDACPK
jgi:hypothetical protein